MTYHLPSRFDAGVPVAACSRLGPPATRDLGIFPRELPTRRGARSLVPLT
jgi:hypothetical protein